ncbi:MAG: hypothetical protein JW915_21230 [Chitinispirillaceae bacterium]|nr:hypothetical protein [Chitinispirillaceae bacterium]
MENNILIYQAHTSEKIYEEALFSILSFIHADPESLTKVVLYTDDAAYFKRYLSDCTRIMYVPLDKPTITEWAGEFNFVHRIKIKMLQDAVARFSGNMIYLDTDTYIHNSLSEYFEVLQNGKMIMHLREYHFSNHKGKHVKKYRKAFLQLPNVQLDTNFEFWNAGAIGFNTRDSDIIEKVLHISDTLFRYCPLHTVEQLAFSYVMSMHGAVIPIEPAVYHYWNFKEFRQVLSNYLQKYKDTGLSELLRNIENINPIRLHLPKLMWERKSSFSRRLKAMFTGKTWNLPEYTL